MADTVAGLIDKLFTVDMKLWNNQEFIYKIRRISYNQFREEYVSSEEKVKILWDALQKICDLNIQRNQLIDEIDLKIIEMFKAIKNGEDLDNGKFIQRKYKTL
jgi:hypothetical protein